MVKKMVKEKKIGKSRGLLIGLIGITIFMACMLLSLVVGVFAASKVGSWIILVAGLLAFGILPLIGLVISKRDCKNRKRLSLEGVIVNIVILILFAFVIVSVLLFKLLLPRLLGFN